MKLRSIKSLHKASSAPRIPPKPDSVEYRTREVDQPERRGNRNGAAPVIRFIGGAP